MSPRAVCKLPEAARAGRPSCGRQVCESLSENRIAEAEEAAEKGRSPVLYCGIHMVVVVLYKGGEISPAPLLPKSGFSLSKLHSSHHGSRESCTVG